MGWGMRESTNRMYARYIALLTAAGITEVTPTGRLEPYWGQATAEVEAELAVLSATASRDIWSSSLGPDVRNIVEAIAAGRTSRNDILSAHHYCAAYEAARTELFHARLAQQGLDVCRLCQAVVPQADIQLVLLWIGVVPNSTGVTDIQEFDLLCATCRNKGAVDGEAFRKVLPAWCVGGLYWVEVDGQLDHAAGGCTIQPDSAKAGQPVLTEKLAAALEIPPSLIVAGVDNGHPHIRIQISAALVPLLPEPVLYRL
jgi:hypothetical protein